MASLVNCFGPFSKRLAKYVNGSHIDRLCFRRVVPLCAVSVRPQSVVSGVNMPRFSSSALAMPMLNVRDMDPLDITSRDQHALCGGSLWMNRVAVHSVLEGAIDFQNTVFSALDFEKYWDIQKKWNTVHFSRDDLMCASPQDLLEFLRFQTTSMGREDFRDACGHIAGQLSGFTNDDLLELAKVLYLVPYQGGNIPIIWEILDEEFLRRFSNVMSVPNGLNLDFFLKAMDVVYWLNFLQRSKFANIFLLNMLKDRSLNYPSGIQLLFYASCGPWEWRNHIDMPHLVSFLNRIKEKCQFDVFLVGAECFSILQYVRRTLYSPKAVDLPNSLEYFLLSKAIENINDDNTLTILTQLFYSCSSKKTHQALFHKLLGKLAERDHVSFLVVFYILHTSANCGIKHQQFLEAMEECLEVEKLHPRTFISTFLHLYGSFGQDAVNKLSKRLAHELKTRNITSLSEGELLKIFVVLLDCGINSSHLWELTMQGDVLVPNFIQNKKLRYNVNGLHLTADDCIEVYWPQYEGSRLSNSLRMQIYSENLNLINDHHHNHNPFGGFVNVVRNITNGCALPTHILPGISCPGIKDVIVCLNKDGSTFRPDIMTRVKPWDVKKIPSSASTMGQTFFALWAPHPNMSSYTIRLKHNALEHLGYTSLMVGSSLWKLPEECRDYWILSKLGLVESEHSKEFASSFN